MSTPLSEIVTLLDSTLRIREIKDASVAMNGLQVENNGIVTKVALAVDGSQKSIDDAIAAGADLLVLHHGIFWCGLQPVTGWWKQKLVSCLSNNLAIYSAHLPLGMHPELGNSMRKPRGHRSRAWCMMPPHLPVALPCAAAAQVKRFTRCMPRATAPTSQARKTTG